MSKEVLWEVVVRRIPVFLPVFLRQSRHLACMLLHTGSLLCPTALVGRPSWIDKMALPHILLFTVFYKCLPRKTLNNWWYIYLEIHCSLEIHSVSITSAWFLSDTFCTRSIKIAFHFTPVMWLPSSSVPAWTTRYWTLNFI